MNIPVESAPLLLVTVEDDRLPQAQRHGRLSIFSITLFLASTIDQNLCTLHHQALDQSLILVSARRAERRIEVPKIQLLQPTIRKHLLTYGRHAPKILPAPHARRNINIKIVDHRAV